jgi:hypothetical protein
VINNSPGTFFIPLTISKEKDQNLLMLTKEKGSNLLMASKDFLDKKQETA